MVLERAAIIKEKVSVASGELGEQGQYWKRKNLVASGSYRNTAVL
jgi:hypothetical protein